MTTGNDSKISGLDPLTTPNGRDLLVIVDMPVSNNSTAVVKNITLKTFFGNVTSNTSINGSCVVNKDLTANNVVIKNSSTPANNSISVSQNGTLWWDDNYIYLKISNKIRRIALEDF